MKTRLQDFFIKPSTRRFIREAQRVQGYSLYDFLHGYVYARWPYLYIGIGTGEHRLAKLYKAVVDGIRRLVSNGPFDGDHKAAIKKDSPSQSAGGTFADGYHGKVVPLESASRLVTVNAEIDLPDLEQVIPYERARAIIMRNPDHIAVLECPCRSSRQSPCLPLDVCLVIGEPFASFVAEHHPERSRWIRPAEAVAILHAEDERGHVHHAFFKDAMLGRFYAICNCCSCCCGAMNAHRNGTPMLAASGYVSRVDEELCIGCDECAHFCQFGALSMHAGVANVDILACMGCGVCVEKCALNALSLVRDVTKGEPLEITELIASMELDNQV